LKNSTQRNESRKLRRLKSKLSYYRAALDDIKGTLFDYEKEWLSDITRIKSKACKQNDNKKEIDTKTSVDIKNFENASEEKDQNCNKEDNSISDKKHPRWVKKLFKKIAYLTHPDKLIGELEKEKFSDLFNKSREALDNTDYDRLVEIGDSLNVEIDLSINEIILKLEKRLDSIVSEISLIEKSSAWMWGESFGIIDIRLKIAKYELESSGAGNIHDGDIIDIILDIESKM
jgi:hypothetical protein